MDGQGRDGLGDLVDQKFEGPRERMGLLHAASAWAGAHWAGQA